MDLISPLAAGVSGAEGGTATIRKRGTATAATWYADFEGTSANATGDALDLDSHGRTLAYVNELVEVTVQDSSGSTLLTFTAGTASPDVEVRSQSFTGQDYTTAASAASNPTTLQQVLDLWKTNSGGAIDWKVKVGGTSSTLATLLGAVSGLVYNVKDPTYGATGDGSTDDTSAVGAAFTACGTTGGIVFFPPGSYKTTSNITLGPKTSLLGCGPGASKILMAHASNTILTASTLASTAEHQVIEGLTIAPTQNHSGVNLSVADGTDLLVRNCCIGSASYSTGTDLVSVASSTTTRLSFSDCSFYVNGSSAGMVLMSGTSLRTSFTRCRFVAPASYSPGNGAVCGRTIDLDGCYFDSASATAGTFSWYKTNGTGLNANIRGCSFPSSGGATVTAIELGTYASTSVFREAQNSFGSSGITAYSYTCAAASLGADVQLITRETRKIQITQDASTPALPTDQYGYVLVRRTSNANQAFPGVMAPEGATGIVSVWNNSGADITTEIPDAPFAPETGAGILNTVIKSWLYRAEIHNSTAYLRTYLSGV